MDVAASYDSAAGAYVEHLYSELAGKPLDRHLLNRFAEEVRGKGLVADLGCGPGHVAKYLRDQGVDGLLGIDLSPEMIRWASRLNPALDFRVGDMRALDLPDGALAGIVAFYSIVHFEPADLPAVLNELRRVLVPEGSCSSPFTSATTRSTSTISGAGRSLSIFAFTCRGTSRRR